MVRLANECEWMGTKWRKRARRRIFVIIILTFARCCKNSGMMKIPTKTPIKYAKAKLEISIRYTEIERIAYRHE